MANTKITQLPAVTALAGTDVFPVVDVSASATSKVSVEDLLRNAPDGAAGAPSIANAGDQDTGIFFPAENSVGVSTDGTQRLVIDSSGNVGIGTTSPGANLHLSSTGDTIARVTSADGNGAFLDLGDASDPDGGRIVYDSGSNLTFSTASTERLRIDSSGRLLIGTSTSPSGGDAHAQNAPLLVQGRIGSDADSGRINLQRGSAASNGSSIGTVSFTDSSNNAYARLEVEADAGTGSGDYPGRIKFLTTANAASSPTERMRIDSSGDVKIGGTLPSSPNIILQANGNYEGKGQIKINRTDAVSTIFQGLDNGNETSLINKDGSARFKGGIVSSSTGAESDFLSLGGTLLGDYGGLQAIRPLGTTSLNTKDVFIGGHGNTETSKIFADGSATFGGTLHVESGSAGSVTANSAADDLIVENSGDTGISILAANGNNTSAVFFGNATDAVGAAIRWNHDSNQMQIGPDKSGAHLRFNSGDGAEAVRIDSSGNVGIAESAPDVRLHVKTSSDDVAKLESTSGGNGPNLILAHTGASPADDDTVGKLSFSATNDNSQETTFADIKVISTDVSDGSEDAAFTFGTRNNGTFAERLRLDSTGRLGLGTSNPTADLEVEKPTSASLEVGNTAGQRVRIEGGSSGVDFTTPNALNMTFGTSNTERLRVDSSGNVGIGATDVNAPLEVRNSSALQIRTSTGTGTYWEFGRDNSTGDFFLADDGLGTVVAVDQITGDVGIGTTSPAFTEGGGLRIERASRATLRLQDTGAHGFEISASSDEAKFRTMNNKRFVFANSSNNELFRITGTGIAFNGDTAGANRLNDYEEGTFTPEFAGSTTAGTYTYGSRTGHYTKIGDMVNVTIKLENINTSTAGTGDINITGLPFTSANNGSFACGTVILDQFNTAGSTRSLAVRNSPNTAILAIHEIRDSLTDDLMSVGDKVTNVADIQCTITYRV